ELVWAMLTRSDPATSIDIIRNAWSTPLDPRIEPERKAVGDLTNSRAVIDACRPWHWRDKFPKVHVPTPEERRMAREKFGHLLATCSEDARNRAYAGLTLPRDPRSQAGSTAEMSLQRNGFRAFAVVPGP